MKSFMSGRIVANEKDLNKANRIANRIVGTVILLFIGALLATVLSSCGDNPRYRRHKSKLLHEQGLVIAKQYQPEVNETATGVGMSMSGNLVLTSHNINIRQSFDVVFKCDHGVVFTISDPDLYAKLKEGDKVTIDYYEIINGLNEVVDLDFVDATPTNNRY